MKVHIGQYPEWWGPYQIANLLQHVGVSKDTCDKIGEYLSNTKLNDLCSYIQSLRKQKVSIKLHPYDTWSMDHTLAMLIVPMLHQLKVSKHGAPYTDDADVPDHIKSTNAPPKENDWDTDAFHFIRWDWILDELIWSFERRLQENDEVELISDEDDARKKNGYRLFGKYYENLWD